jgi:hypothetical protein
MRLRLLENLHIPLWLIKDLCWAMLWRPVALVMIAPAILLALFFVVRSRKSMPDFFPNLSIACWICANSIWMLDEFYAFDIRNYCFVFFLAGVVSIAWWLFFYFPAAWKKSGEKQPSDPRY